VTWLDVPTSRTNLGLGTQRNGANAQVHRLYGTYTDAANYERLTLATVAGGTSSILKEQAGTGVAGGLRIGTTGNANVQFQIAGTDRWFFDAPGGGHFKTNTDNTVDIGASAASRPRTVYAGTSMAVGSATFAAGGLTNSNDAANLQIAGGTGGASGNFVVYGGTHATLANYIQLRQGTAIRWQVEASGHFAAGTDNANDIGTATLRPRTVYAGTSVVLPTRPAGTNDTTAATTAFVQNAVAGSSGSPRKNYIINGRMEIDQRNRGTAIAAAANGARPLDMWVWNQAGSGVLTVGQSTDAPVGSNFSLAATVTTADAVLDATDKASLETRVEGLDWRSMGYGGASAITGSLLFDVKSSLTGTHCVVLRNALTDRVFCAEYTVIAANTWESKQITVPGDTAGTWAVDNTIGLKAHWALRAGSSQRTATTGAWAASGGVDIYGTANQVDLLATLGNAFKVANVRLVQGTTALGLDPRPYAVELMLCQRYLPVFSATGGTGDRFPGNATSTSNSSVGFTYPVFPRVAPTGISTPNATLWSVYSWKGAALGACTSMSLNTGGPTIGQVNFGTTAGTPTLALGDPVAGLPNSTSALLIFTGAEL
jgi:hypothetical protein